MDPDPTTFLTLKASIPSPYGPAEHSVHHLDGVALIVTVFPSPGQASEIEVLDERRADDHSGFFSAGVDADGHLVAVEGTGDMDSWRSCGRPLPPRLEEHRDVLEPAIELAAETARLVGESRAGRNRPRPPRQEPVSLATLPVRLQTGGQTAADAVVAFLNTL